MSVITEVMKRTGATRADIIRVATWGGDTRADWGIAHAIEAAGGRNAHELMFTAGREAEIAEIWADSRTDIDPVAPTNPRAVHDPEVVIYPENTSPDETRQVVPHHPGDHDDQTNDNEDHQEQDDRAAAEQLANTVLADLAEVLDDTPAAIRLTRAWSTPTEGRLLLHQVLRATPRTRYATPSIAPAA